MDLVTATRRARSRNERRNAQLRVGPIDPMRVDDKIDSLELRVARVMKKYQKDINEIVEKFKGPEALVQQQGGDVERGLVEIRSELDQISARLGRELTDIVRQGVGSAYRSGRGFAQRQLRRMERIDEPDSALDDRDRELIALLRDLNLDRVKTIAARHIDEAKAIIAQGRIDGIQRRDIVRQLAERMKLSEFQARRIVRTEIIRAANTAARRQYLDSGVRYWQWQVARTRSTRGDHPHLVSDERVCPVCKPLHARVVKIGEPFNPYLSAKGRERLKETVLTMPPAHPHCRCIMSPAWPPTYPARRQVPKGRPVRVVRAKIAGFTNYQRQQLHKVLRHIPQDVKKKVKVLRGEWPIKRTVGRVMDDPEVQSMLGPATRQQFAEATGLYVGGRVNRVFVGRSAGQQEVFHEVGHAVYDEYLGTRTRTRNQFDRLHAIHDDSGDFPTGRSAISPREFFADAFRFYLLKPADLKFKFPEVYEYLRREVFFGNERDKIVTLSDEGKFKMKISTGEYVEYVERTGRL